MQMEMTQRDKKLLMYLGLFVVIVCFGYWGVRPLIKGITETDEAIIEAETEKEINELKILELPMLEMENEELEENIVKARQSFYPMMTADQIDKMMTGMALDYNLYAYDLSIAMPKEEARTESYKYAVKSDFEEDIIEEDVKSTTVEDIDEYASEGKKDKEVVEMQTYDASTGIYIATINMKVGGDGIRLQKLIDDLSTAKEKQLVREYSWEDKASVRVTDTGDYEYVSERYLNITLDIYMCEE